MNIAYHCTDNYARITATSILSLFENNKDIDKINIYIIENGFSQKTKNKFNNLADRYGRNIFFIPLPDLNSGDYQLGLVSIKRKWVFDSYSRLFLDKLLPKTIGKVIYLDGDTLVVGSLKKLWEMDLKGKCCAACLDCISASYYDLFGIKKTNRYCNSGLILMDLDAWRNKHISRAIKKYVRNNNGYIFFMEQTVFNVVLQEEMIYLPASYNVSSLEQVLSYKNLIRLRKPLHFYSKEEVQKALENPLIIHMTGFFYIINRAWNEVTNHPEKQRFIEYSEKLKWDGDILQKDQRNIKTRIKDMIIHIIPTSVLMMFISIVYNFFRVKNIERICKRKKYIKKF